MDDIEAKKASLMGLKNELKSWRREEFVKTKKPEEKESKSRTDIDDVRDLLKKLEK